MESTQDQRLDLSPCWSENHECTSKSNRRKLRCGGSGFVLLLTILAISSLANCYIPETYPIEVYHMLQERSQYGLGRDNRVRGSWGAWSSWSDCSRSCGTGVQSQARECTPPRALRKRSITGGFNSTSLKPICIGIDKRYHICNIQECLNSSEDPRVEQCAKYNTRLYKGESYSWVPFLSAPNPCALNCRAGGQRFYATLEPAVVDGTPCDGPNLRAKSTGFSIDRTEQWLCVAGQCKSVGCDGVVGSGVVKDACGVCGGQGRGCKLYEGIFMEPTLPKGHQPVTNIPKGAMSLNISELRYSGNFLALRAENGSYILNGPYAVSPSGIYKTAGTIVTYQRGDKHRMETITATGPLHESLSLEIWYHETNPGVLYKYMLPAPEIPEDNISPPFYTIGSNTNDIPESISQINPARKILPERKPDPLLPKNLVKEQSENENKEQMKLSTTTVMSGDEPGLHHPHDKKKKKKKRKFEWKVTGLTPCTKTCGGGIQNAIMKCVREDKGFEVPDRRCRRIEKPQIPPSIQCNDRPCPARWKADAWSECSTTCGSGVKTRRIECIQELNSKMTMRVASGACSQPPDLSTVGNCVGPPCPEIRRMMATHKNSTPRWDVGPWGHCSSTCGKGVRNRTVTCITTREPCSQSTKPMDERICETPCNFPPQRQVSVWLYTDWSPKCMTECGREVETRRVACGDVSELFCDPTSRPATERRCPTNEIQKCREARWFTGPWSSCSVLCGEGTARREVICIGNSSGESKILPESNCKGVRPQNEQSCRMPPCKAEWYTSDWSECSVSCGGGTQERVVRCLEEGIEVLHCQSTVKPDHKKSCNDEVCKMDIPNKIPKKVHLTHECMDKYPNCESVVKVGLCRMKYYKHSCCGCRDSSQSVHNKRE